MKNGDTSRSALDASPGNSADSAPGSLPLAPFADAAAELPLTVIERRPGWRLIDFRELWRYRDLFLFLTWRDISVRYKQTVLGALWAIIQPFMAMIVFSVFFGRLGGLDKQTGSVPYPIFVYAGLLPWTLFSQALGRSSESVVGSSNLITKVYFPRLVIPTAATGACLVDFAISFLVLIGMMVYYGIVPHAGVLMLPVFVVLVVVSALGVGTFVSALNVSYRDFRYVIPFMIQIWMFATPVIYPVTIVPERWRWVLSLNPMAGVIDGCRASILGTPFDWPNIGLSALVAIVFFVFGLFYFRRVERRFADII
jgi:lipopolysaccharide transport system permease protein